jgi:hypothetical protein
MWKEAVVAEFDILSGNLSGGTEEDRKHLRIVNMPTEIRTAHPPNTTHLLDACVCWR